VRERIERITTATISNAISANYADEVFTSKLENRMEREEREEEWERS
jgi:hypothetical protein